MHRARTSCQPDAERNNELGPCPYQISRRGGLSTITRVYAFEVWSLLNCEQPCSGLDGEPVH